MRHKIFVVLILILQASILSVTVPSQTRPTKEINLAAAATTQDYYTDVLEYDDAVWLYYPDPLTSGDTIHWAFSGSNTYVGITVRAMDEDNIEKFEAYSSYDAYTLSNGDFISDSGKFEVPYTNIWYIVFSNEDSDREPTTINYDIRFTPVSVPIPPHTATLHYEDAVWLWFPDPLSSYDSIYWAFAGSNEYVGIQVQAMDEDNIEKFEAYNPYDAYTLSNGDFISDSGEFEVPYSNTWYIVFSNEDSDRETTTINYDISFDPVSVSYPPTSTTITTVPFTTTTTIQKTTAQAITTTQIMTKTTTQETTAPAQEITKTVTKENVSAFIPGFIHFPTVIGLTLLALVIRRRRK